jgi:tetratricopeptide (TPR) repeat protein
MRLNDNRPLIATTAIAFAVALAVFLLVNRSTGPGPDSAGGAPGDPAGTSAEARVLELEAAIADGVTAPQAFVALGDALLQQSREAGEDPSLHARAETAFTEALDRDPGSLGATVGLGNVALGRHEFETGLGFGRDARRLSPRSFAPFAVLVDAQIELGRYGAAARTLQQMVDLKPGLASYARVSYYRELHGDLGGAVEAMRMAVSASPGPGENRAYLQTLLGGLEFQRGRLADAEASYRTALAAFPDYPAAQLGLARVDAARGRPAPAIARLNEIVRRQPLPDNLAALAEMQLAAGLRAEARANLARARVEETRLHGGGVSVDVEGALFQADHGDPSRALAIARHTYAAAPSVRAADALGWALTRNGKPRQGLARAREALRLGSRDPFFLYHAGIAALGADKLAAGRAYLKQALAANPGFSVLHAKRARRALQT